MDGLIIICALVGITAECSRRMWRAFGRGDAETAAPRPYQASRLSRWLADVDWERCLGLRYEHAGLPPARVPRRNPVAPRLFAGVQLPPARAGEEFVTPIEAEEAEPSNFELVERLESGLVQGVVQVLLDDLELVEAATAPAEEKSRLENAIVTGRFVTIDSRAGQPVGDPGVFEELPAPRRLAVLEAVSAAETLTAVVMVDFAPVAHPAAGSYESLGEPVGDPGVEDGLAAAPAGDQPRLMSFPDGTLADYRIAASLRKSPDEYAVAAYTLNSSDDKDGIRNDGAGEEEELAPDPLAEIISEILEEEEPGEDPNTLELPLEIAAGAETIGPPGAGEPVGDPGVFEVCLPAPPVAAAESAPDAADAEEPSAPIEREVNRISARVESILSSALARPAPAVNFSDALEKMAERSRARKQAKEAAASRLPSQAVDDNVALSADRDGGLKMTEYKVQFEIFEGPLDLLLYLVKKQEVDIYEVNLTQIAEEFIKYIDLMRSFDLEVAGEFLVMAASLMYIKSKELLPVEQQTPLDDDDEEEDPRWELIRQLVEYKKFKDAAADFKRLELAQEDVFPNNPPKPDFPVQRLKANVSVFDLLGAVNRVLERIDSKETREIFADRWTVSEKIEQIRNEILAKGRVKFFDLFEDAMSRTEVVATFLALLELIKLKVIVVEQSAVFSDIDICKAPAGHRLNLDESEEGDLPLEAEAVAVSEFDAPTGDEE